MVQTSEVKRKDSSHDTGAVLGSGCVASDTNSPSSYPDSFPCLDSIRTNESNAIAVVSFGEFVSPDGPLTEQALDAPSLDMSLSGIQSTDLCGRGIRVKNWKLGILIHIRGSGSSFREYKLFA